MVYLFVDNLPESICEECLWQNFKFEGSIIDVFISCKKRKKKDNHFGFVRFQNVKDASKMIEHLHGLEIRGCKISVQIATYRRAQPQYYGNHHYRDYEKMRNFGFTQSIRKGKFF